MACPVAIFDPACDHHRKHEREGESVSVKIDRAAIPQPYVPCPVATTRKKGEKNTHTRWPFSRHRLKAVHVCCGQMGIKNLPDSYIKLLLRPIEIKIAEDRTAEDTVPVRSAAGESV